MFPAVAPETAPARQWQQKQRIITMDRPACLPKIAWLTRIAASINAPNRHRPSPCFRTNIPKSATQPGNRARAQSPSRCSSARVWPRAGSCSGITSRRKAGSGHKAPCTSALTFGLDLGVAVLAIGGEAVDDLDDPAGDLAELGLLEAAGGACRCARRMPGSRTAFRGRRARRSCCR